MVEAIYSTKYKSKDGNIYDTLQQATEADLRFLAPFGDQILRYEKLGHGFLRGISLGNDSPNYAMFPHLVVLHAEHEKLYYLANKLDDLHKIYFDIFVTNLDAGWYSNDETGEKVSEKILQDKNTLAAIGFVRSRINYEHEEVTREHFVQLP